MPRRRMGRDVAVSAQGYLMQACHRMTAVEGALKLFEQEAALADTRTSDPVLLVASKEACSWLGETLLQGAYLREYHAWEKDTKQYLDVRLAKNGEPAVRWQKGSGSHVDKVKVALALLGSPVPDGVIRRIDAHRDRINKMKHASGWSDEDVATGEDFDAAASPIVAFWQFLLNSEMPEPTEPPFPYEDDE